MFFITNPSLLLFCIANVIFLLNAANGLQWPSAEQEALDEINDAKILKAVQTSMKEWNFKKSLKHRRKRADKSVCYGDLGCFEDSGPFGYLDMLPSSPEEIGTKFYIYSTKNRSDKPLLEFSFMNVTGAWGESYLPTLNGSTVESDNRPTLNLDALEDLRNVSTRIIVHGFGSSCTHVWIYEMRTALMAVENCIVLCIDWENGATLPNYVRAAANSRLVGKQLAMLLHGLTKYKNLDLTRTHIIGFSLGAHVAGFAGSESKGLNRITGLDPAGPLFESQHPKARLDSTDASFVDVVHSNGENLILGGLGSWQPMGHVDFYPNGGRVQHGCSNLFVGALTDFIWTSAAAAEGRSLCNHRRAYKFFIDSVAPRCLFPAFPCESYDSFIQGKCFPCDKALEHTDNESKCGNMGYYADRSTGRGQLYLVTREEEPFCAHQYNVEIHSALNDLPLRTLGRMEITLEGEGGLNETFTITEKDDTELFAGDTISRILVPHPALGFPSTITVTYKSYSGWLSKGLPNWKIYKVILTDSFGVHSSVCKRFFTLESGKSVRMALQPGECHIPDENDHIELLGFPTKNTNSTTYENLVSEKYNKIGPSYASDENLGLRNGADTIDKRDVLKLGHNFKVLKNFTYPSSDDQNLINLPWQPVLDENSLGRIDSETSRSLKEEIFEPILKTPGKRNTYSSNREPHSLRTDKDDIKEPILKPTTQNIQNKIENFETTSDSSQRSFEKTRNLEKVKSKPRETGFITVQLLPFRLGEILDRAERYARLTLLPLITEQAPRFFGFDNTATQHSSSSQVPKETPKYFPPLGDLADESEIDEIKNKNRKRDDTKVTGYVEESQSTESTSPKNLLESMRTNSTKILQQRSISSQPKPQYYTNSDETSDDEDYEDLKVIKINLPTYKPPSFPYRFEVPHFTEEPSVSLTTTAVSTTETDINYRDSINDSDDEKGR